MSHKKENLFWIYKNHDPFDIETLVRRTLLRIDDIKGLFEGSGEEYNVDLTLWSGKRDLRSSVDFGSADRGYDKMTVHITDMWLGQTDPTYKSEIGMKLSEYIEWTVEYLNAIPS